MTQEIKSIDDVKRFAEELLLPPKGKAVVYQPGRTDVGDFKTALELLLVFVSQPFTGHLELNYKDGKLMDVNETKRTKL